MARQIVPLRYGRTAAFLHWASAIAIVFALVIGLLARQAPGEHRAEYLLRVHLPLGILVVLLTLARILWRLFDVRPMPIPDQPRRQVLLSRVVHALLTLVPLLLGLSGTALLIVSGALPILFGGAAGPLPAFTRFPPMRVHASAAIALAVLLAVHLLAVVYHQVFHKHRLLARMRIGDIPEDRP